MTQITEKLSRAQRAADATTETGPGGKPPMLNHSVTFAIQTAAVYHHGQMDKIGQHYIFHALEVMLRCNRQGASDEVLIAALFHDVVEDCHVPAQHIMDVFGEEVFKLVDLLTRRSTEAYLDYIHRVKTDPQATQIKLADLAENMRPDRDCRDGKKVDRMERYRTAVAILEGRLL